MKIVQSEHSRGLIRSLNRSGVRDDKSPPVVHKTSPPHEPTICARCGVVFIRKTWRHDHVLSDEQIEHGERGFCPACVQVAKQEGQGHLVIQCAAAVLNEDAIRRRIQNERHVLPRRSPNDELSPSVPGTADSKY